jgi:hypothetical protein
MTNLLARVGGGRFYFIDRVPRPLRITPELVQSINSVLAAQIARQLPQATVELLLVSGNGPGETEYRYMQVYPMEG